MSTDGSISLEWAGGAHVFRLAIGELRQLQDKLESGPLQIFDRLLHRTWRIDDLRETIRLGLIGGNMPPMQANKLVRLYVEARPPAESLQLAKAILAAALIGPPDEDAAPGKDAPEQAMTGATGASSSPASMAPAPP